jgi:nucleotide-binding universal stress UspA family protein
MEQPGSQSRPEQPDRADGPRRPPRLRGRERAGDPQPQPLPQPQPSSPGRPAQVPGGRDPAHPVVVGYDGSPSSRNALAYAAGLARRLARPMLVVYVIPFGVYCEPMTGQVICTARERQELEPWLVAELDQACDCEGLDVRVMARRGNAAKELAAAADASSADALVVGAPGHRLHHLVGSIPSWLARHARCPVIVVP